MGWLIDCFAAGHYPSGYPSLQGGERNRGSPEKIVAQCGIAEQGAGSFLALESAWPSKSSREKLCCFSDADCFCSGGIQDTGGGGTEGESSQCIRVGVALPDHVESRNRKVDRLTGVDSPSNIDKHAVTEIDGVVQAKNQASSAVFERVIFENAFAR